MAITTTQALQALQLDAGTSLEEAKTVFRQLAKQYHPDSGQTPNAAQFQLCHQAIMHLCKELKTVSKAVCKPVVKSPLLVPIKQQSHATIDEANIDIHIRNKQVIKAYTQASNSYTVDVYA